MVASNDIDLYSPFHHPSMIEEGPQSSDDGSGLHSPVFAEFQSPHNDFRYHDQVNIEHAASLLATHLDYSPSVIQQQPPLIDTTSALETPSQVNFDFSIPPRNQIEYLAQSSGNFRPSYIGSSEALNFRYGSSQQRSSSRQSHDQSITRSSASLPMDGDQHRTLLAEAAVAAGGRSRDRKDTPTVVIACRQCRSRKIRCDSTRPVCNNCQRRKNVCEYDSEPKRRGPDKRPGTRRRSCKKRPVDGSTPPPPKRKKTADTRIDSATAKVKENMSEKKRATTKRDQEISQGAPALRILTDDLNDLIRTDTSSIEDDQLSHKSFLPPSDINVPQSASDKMTHVKFPPPLSPSMDAEQRQWWIRFQTTYQIKDIAEHVEYLFSDTGHWLSFLNLHNFLETLWHNENRYTIRPPLILSILAMATLMKSSQAEFGGEGREQAILLRDSAQAALDASWNSGWVDTMLAESALILTLFETSLHPQYNPDRIASSLTFLDNIIRHLGLTGIDADDTDVNAYPPGSVPVVHTSGPDDPERKCTCIPMDAIHPPDPVTSWSYPPPWDSAWTPAEIRDEECRRVCWCAVGLIASYNAQCIAFDHKCPNLFLSDCSNFSLLFPGEVIDRASPAYRSVDSQSPKESVWALYCRSMLMFNYSNRLCEDSERTPEANAELAQESWSETQAIQDSLDMHICNLDTALIYMTREYIYNTRINLTQVFRSLYGLNNRSRILNRRQAQDWLYYQDQVIKRVRMSIQDITDPRGHQLTRRPFQATWFSNQLSICLILFHHDHALIAALDLAKSIVVPIDVMNVLWPCPLQQRHCDILREQLTDACRSAGIDPPLDPQFSIPPALQGL